MPHGNLFGHRNFNVCPHCESQGHEPILSRLNEGIPMISRSDGKTFHLVLADKPRPYPEESSAGPTEQLSVCFWYAQTQNPSVSNSVVVLLRSGLRRDTSLFRQIEDVADLLATELSEGHSLATFYSFVSDALFELRH
jgi:hypothetical protein